MKKVLLIGNCPLPEENSKSRPAAGLRTNQFLRALIDGGFDVKLAKIAMPECYEGEIELGEDVFSKDDKDLIIKIQKQHDDYHPDAIVAVNTFPSYIASLLDFRVPLWTDLNGWIMAEAQAQAYKEGGNEYLGHYYNMEKSILRRTDKVSAVSRAEQFAITGELAMLGRLNDSTFLHPFVEHIPNATEWFKGEEGAEKINLGLKEDAFVLLWVGGYNTWVDEVNLFKGVEDAMKACSSIYFVSTGGGIKGLGNKTFDKFKEMVEQSVYKDRFIFLGWLPTEKIPGVYKSADVGLNIDRLCVETMTGARNRINEMMKFGLPVISTLGSEIAGEMANAKAGIGIVSGSHEELTSAIVEMFETRHSAKFKQYGENGQEFTKMNSYTNSLQPLLSWLENPRPAPDRGVKVSLGGFLGSMSIKAVWKYLRHIIIKRLMPLQALP